MQFNSFTFFCLTALVVLLQRSRFAWGTKKVALLCVSYFFYAAWQVEYLGLIWLSTLIDWFVVALLSAEERPGRRKALLVVSLTANLGLLAFFKYAAFLFSIFEDLGAIVGWQMHFERPSILLPVGISFYTFQTLSYTIDVYRRRLEPAQSFLDYALYVAFFPQLVAGPIVRASDFLPQLQKQVRPTAHDYGWGVLLFVIGLWEKSVLADGLLAQPAEWVFDGTAAVTPYLAWVGTLAFTGQIFADFAGYSTCAIGIARILGFHIPINFYWPYGAAGFSDFWRRWHISLSTWLRDYLYIPLGGNRGSLAFTLRNIMITMLLGGLWHGASWNFVLWGALHGILLALERLVRHWRLARFLPGRLRTPLAILLTLFGVMVTWIFFRASSLDRALEIAAALFGYAQDHTPYELPLLNQLRNAVALIVALLLIVGHWMLRNTDLEQRLTQCSIAFRAALIGVLVVTICLMSGVDRAFIYFQF
ncbi:MAG: MBOAT family protein [Bdellovibrionales bacterium]|nr:MBOAT family protein [Bdellovibrionales bacterium]